MEGLLHFPARVSPKVPDDDFIVTPVVEHILPIEIGPFTIEELYKVIKDAKRGGAVGIDCIPIEIWESPHFTSYLLELCNIGLLQHRKPEQWSKSAIKPTPKRLQLLSSQITEVSH